MVSRDFKRILIREKSYITKGISEVNSLKTFVSLFLLVAIYFNQLGIRINYVYVIITFFVSLVGLRYLGWIWDKAHLYHEEQEFSNSRNYFINEVLSRLKKKDGN